MYVCMYVCMCVCVFVHMYMLSLIKLRYASCVSPSISNRIIEAARGWLNKIVPDVYIYTDLAKKKESKRYEIMNLNIHK